jgi:hypothetical protein
MKTQTMLALAIRSAPGIDSNRRMTPLLPPGPDPGRLDRKRGAGRSRGTAITDPPGDEVVEALPNDFID